jgi:hypothetical protein
MIFSKCGSENKMFDFYFFTKPLLIFIVISSKLNDSHIAVY